MLTEQLRQTFIDFFVHKNHMLVPSSSLVPNNDQTLLFTNAGMVQFKDFFLNPTLSKYKRAVSCQRCIRAGGKHNDLENVGFTARHHTFFEMLGNFSFGDYFKEEAISFAFEFVTKVLQLPKDKLWITVYKDDDASFAIWNKIGFADTRIIRCDADNFWAMGDAGPCGPCTEIFYDHGSSLIGDPPGGSVSGDRFVEIWNLVFMQYNRDSNGNMHQLPKPCVDTGSGLERLAAVMQGVHSNYDIDLFVELIKGISETLKISLTEKHVLHILADHMRATSFLLADGVFPSNEGRGYVLRRIMRRAIRYGHSIGQKEPFLYRLVPILINLMHNAYPALKNKEQDIQTHCKREEEQFFITLEQGVKLFTNYLQNNTSPIISGAFAFKLYDTYGFPIDLTQIMAQENKKTIDMEEFNAAMDTQRQKSRQASMFNTSTNISGGSITNFVGYETLTSTSVIQEIYVNNKPVDHLSTGESGILVLDVTPFYANSGGQVGDIGKIFLQNNVFQVTDTQKANKTFLHYGTLINGTLHVEETVYAEVDPSRHDIKINHTATHLLHAALRQILGPHVEQKGSSVDKYRLRFDFTHKQPLSPQEIKMVEDLVNYQIRISKNTQLEIMSLEEATKKGALAFFNEKYGDLVRVLNLNDGFSIELCGGTHVANVGEIGIFKIISEQSIANNIRRIEAITGRIALEWLQEQTNTIATLRQILKVDTNNVIDRTTQLLQKIKTLETEVARYKQKLFAIATPDILKDIQVTTNFKYLIAPIDTASPQDIRHFMDKTKDVYDPIIIIIIAQEEKWLYVSISNGINNISAPELIKKIAPLSKGGGKNDFAQANIAGINLDDILQNARQFCIQHKQ